MLWCARRDVREGLIASKDPAIGTVVAVVYDSGFGVGSVSVRPSRIIAVRQAGIHVNEQPANLVLRSRGIVDKNEVLAALVPVDLIIKSIGQPGAGRRGPSGQEHRQIGD